MISRIILKLVTAILSWPSWETADRFGFALGRLAFRLGIRRELVLDNLTQVFASPNTPPERRRTPEQIRAIAIKAYENAFATFVMFARAQRMDAKFFAERFEADAASLDVLRRAHAAGRGVIAIGGHVGIWDVALMKVGRLGYPNAIIGKNIKNPVFDEWTKRVRADHGESTIPPKNSRPLIIDELRAGRLVTQAVDQNMTARLGTFVDVMGRAASTVRSTPGIVRETGCVVISGYARRIAPGRYRLIADPEVPWISHPDPERENLLNTQHYSRIFDRVILEKPEDWFWLHRRWKRRPENEDETAKFLAELNAELDAILARMNESDAPVAPIGGP